MQTKIEAPAPEPLSLAKTAVTVSGVSRAYQSRRGAVSALQGVDLRVDEGEVVAVVGPSGCGKSTLLELIAGLQEPDGGSVEAGGARDARGRLDACAYMPQRDLLLPWRDALANAALALECQGASKAEARRRAAPLFERFGLAEFERSYPARAVGRDAPARGLPAHAARRARRCCCWTSRSRHSTRSPARRCRSGWPAPSPASRARCVLVTHDTEEALFLADRVAVMSPRPGRVVEELAVPFPRPRKRRETVTDAAFAELRQRALEALER